MPEVRRKFSRALVTIASLAVVAGGGVIAYFGLNVAKNIFDLLTENKELRQAITNLTDQRRIGYAKVLKQENRNGVLWTRLVFVVTDPQDPSRRLLEREYEVEGDVVHFDAMIVKFDKQAVMDGKERALHLWRRVYSDKMKPEDGFFIEQPGAEPARYSRIFGSVSPWDRDLFWKEIWKLSEDPQRLASGGIQAIYGNGIYKQMKSGVIYIFNLDASGTFYPETVPDL